MVKTDTSWRSSQFICEANLPSYLMKSVCKTQPSFSPLDTNIQVFIRKSHSCMRLTAGRVLCALPSPSQSRTTSSLHSHRQPRRRRCACHQLPGLPVAHQPRWKAASARGEVHSLQRSHGKCTLGWISAGGDITELGETFSVVFCLSCCPPLFWTVNPTHLCCFVSDQERRHELWMPFIDCFSALDQSDSPGEIAPDDLNVPPVSLSDWRLDGAVSGGSRENERLSSQTLGWEMPCSLTDICGCHASSQRWWCSVRPDPKQCAVCVVVLNL